MLQSNTPFTTVIFIFFQIGRPDVTLDEEEEVALLGYIKHHF